MGVVRGAEKRHLLQVRGEETPWERGMTDVMTTESNLRRSLSTWETRRAKDIEFITGPRPNIMPFASRVAANMRAFDFLQRRGVDLRKTKILDAGCSDGYGMALFMALGIYADQLTGVDILTERLERGREINPGPSYVHSDIADIKLPSESFDITCEQFCFVHCPVESARQAGARELIRLTKTGGHIIVCDWRYSRKSKDLYGVSREWINKHFGVGTMTERLKTYPAMLVPPVGRVVSRFAPDLYFLIGRFLPFLVGAQLTVLRKV